MIIIFSYFRILFDFKIIFRILLGFPQAAQIIFVKIHKDWITNFKKKSSFTWNRILVFLKIGKLNFEGSSQRVEQFKQLFGEFCEKYRNLELRIPVLKPHHH